MKPKKVTMLKLKDILRLHYEAQLEVDPLFRTDGLGVIFS